MVSLADRLKEHAAALGFDRAGIAPAAPADGFADLQDWLARGFAGRMDYMTRHGEARRHPNSVLPEVRTVVMVALNYAQVEAAPPQRGQVSRYAQGADYHDVLREKLNDLLAWVRGQHPEVVGRGVVDTAPLLERDFARRAGLGWFGKNTMLLHPRLGSWFFLGALLLDLDLEVDAPFETAHCGTCTACLDACPTQAFPEPGVLDARRCISYLTIELRGSMPEDLRAGVGDWLFGCDVCQEVCPWNRKAPPGNEPRLKPRPDLAGPDARELLTLTEEEFRRRFRGTALWRTKRAGLARNSAIVLGNIGGEADLPALAAAAAQDGDPSVREAAAWAIGRIRERPAGAPAAFSDPQGDRKLDPAP